MTLAQRINLALRVVMEVGIVVALAWWGAQATESTATNIALEIGAPLLAFGFWGLVDFHWAGHWSEPLRLLQELAVSGLAAVAWYAAGHHALAWTLAGISGVYHALVYLTGESLLEHTRRLGLKLD